PGHACVLAGWGDGSAADGDSAASPLGLPDSKRGALGRWVRPRAARRPGTPLHLERTDTVRTPAKKCKADCEAARRSRSASPSRYFICINTLVGFTSERRRVMATYRMGNGVEAARTASILNIIAGLWLIIAPFWMGFYTVPGALWNNLIVGIVVAILALIRATNPAGNVGLSWINLLLGLWLIVSPFFVNYGFLVVPMRMDVILGIIVAVLSLWSALATPTYARSVR